MVLVREWDLKSSPGRCHFHDLRGNNYRPLATSFILVFKPKKFNLETSGKGACYDKKNSDNLFRNSYLTKCIDHFVWD
jgi:hypothetical protein